MLVKTSRGWWLNSSPGAVVAISPRGDQGSNAWFGGGEDNYHIFDETPDELAALLNGAATQAPRMVELTIADGRPWGVDPGSVAHWIETTNTRLPDDSLVATCYVTMKGEVGDCYRVLGSYAEIKAALFGESEVPA